MRQVIRLVCPACKNILYLDTDKLQDYISYNCHWCTNRLDLQEIKLELGWVPKDKTVSTNKGGMGTGLILHYVSDKKGLIQTINDYYEKVKRNCK